MANVLAKLLLIILLVFLCSFSFKKIISHRAEIALSPNEELIYFPNGEKLKFLSVGFDNVLANYLWFQTVNYFGKHYREDQEYYWLNHMCDVITELDPKHEEIYEFCSLLIAWEANQPEEAQKMLTKGINATGYWRFYYLRAMNNMMFLKNEAAAKQDFVIASKIPEAPMFVRRMAAKKIAELNDPMTAIEFLQDMVRNSEDPAQKAALTGHLQKAINEYNILQLEKLLEKYEEIYGVAATDITQLKTLGLTNAQLKDPFGGRYYIDKEGKIAFTSKEERITIFSRLKEEKDGISPEDK